MGVKRKKIFLTLILGSVLLCPPVEAARFNPFGLFAPTKSTSLTEGLTAFNRGDFNAAIDALERYAKAFPLDPEPQFWLNKCYEQVVKPTKSAEALSLFQNLKGQQDSILSFTKEPDSSKVYAAQLKTEPNRPRIRALYAIALLFEKAVPQAIIEAEKLLDLPENEDNKVLRQPLLMLLSDAYASQKRIVEAREMLKEAMAIRGNGFLLRQKMQALTSLEEELPSDSEKKIQSQFNEMIKLATDLLKEKKAREAYEAVKQAVELKPDDPGVRGLRGMITGVLSQDLAQEARMLFDKKDLEGASETVSKALSMDPDNQAAGALQKEVKALIEAMQASASLSIEASPSVPLPEATDSVPLPEATDSAVPLPGE